MVLMLCSSFPEGKWPLGGRGSRWSSCSYKLFIYDLSSTTSHQLHLIKVDLSESGTIKTVGHSTKRKKEILAVMEEVESDKTPL